MVVPNIGHQLHDALLLYMGIRDHFDVSTRSKYWEVQEHFGFIYFEAVWKSFYIIFLMSAFKL